MYDYMIVCIYEYIEYCIVPAGKSERTPQEASFSLRWGLRPTQVVLRRFVMRFIVSIIAVLSV